MNTEEYRRNLLEDIKISAEYEMNSIASEFIIHITDILKEAEEFDDFTEGYFNKYGPNRKKMVIDGYHYDPFDKSCVILISDFSNSDNVETLTTKEINKLYEYMKNFVDFSISGYIKNAGYEESLAGYGLAREIEEKIKDIVKFRFYIITDKSLSARVKNIKKENIANKIVELNVWDINRLHDIYTSSLGKESITIDFKKMNSNGLVCVKAIEEDDYSSYLAIIPGDLLAQMYIEYGSRLLEGNVRSFLSVRGKVNKAIRNTILNEPDMFFTYNNGIAATASEVEIEGNSNGTIITKLKDLQIINGGQTTASIANAVLQDKQDVKNIFVAMKLSVVNEEKGKKMIPTISRCANSQNKVNEADFFSNHPYHVRIEEYSRKIYAPATNGNQYETIWFYERARGQYVQEQMKMTKAQRTKFKLKYPKQQLLKKVDISKYINTYDGHPHIVSKGAQASMKYFAEKIDKEWEKSDTDFNDLYYKNIISLAILFKETEKLVSSQQWYKEIKAYRANIVTYSIAIIVNEINKKDPSKMIDLKRIWNKQSLFIELEEQLLKTTSEVLKFITREDRATLNVTEWCKKELCWTRAKKEIFYLLPSFIDTLISKNVEKEAASEAKKERKTINELNAEIKVIELGDIYWKYIYSWAMERRLISPMEQSLLKIASNFTISGRIPSTKQANIILSIREKLYDEGLPKEK